MSPLGDTHVTLRATRTSPSLFRKRRGRRLGRIGLAPTDPPGPPRRSQQVGSFSERTWGRGRRRLSSGRGPEGPERGPRTIDPGSEAWRGASIRGGAEGMRRPWVATASRTLVGCCGVARLAIVPGAGPWMTSCPGPGHPTAVRSFSVGGGSPGPVTDPSSIGVTAVSPVPSASDASSLRAAYRAAMFRWAVLTILFVVPAASLSSCSARIVKYRASSSIRFVPLVADGCSASCREPPRPAAYPEPTRSDGRCNRNGAFRRPASRGGSGDAVIGGGRLGTGIRVSGRWPGESGRPSGRSRTERSSSVRGWATRRRWPSVDTAVDPTSLPTGIQSVPVRGGCLVRMTRSSDGSIVLTKYGATSARLGIWIGSATRIG